MRRLHAISGAASAAVLAIMAGRAEANHGTWLPDVPFGLGTATTVTSWGNPNPTTYTPTVTQNSTTDGALNFNYDTYVGSYVLSSTTYTTVGAGLSGGFSMAPGISVIPGYSLYWAQVVNSVTTIPGSNVWSAATGTSFPDTTNTASPAYPFQYVAVTGATAPTAGFQDFPNRFPIQGNQTWLAEDALVAINTSTNTMDIVDSFDWGFSVSTSTTSPVSVTTPFGWGPASSNYVTTETNAFSTTGINGVTGTTWTVNTNVSVFVPEPAASSAIVLSCAAFLVRRPRRRRQSARAFAQVSYPLPGAPDGATRRFRQPAPSSA